MNIHVVHCHGGGVSEEPWGLRVAAIHGACVGLTVVNSREVGWTVGVNRNFFPLGLCQKKQVQASDAEIEAFSFLQI